MKSLVLMLVVGLIALMTFAYFNATFEVWDGGFPAGVFRLTLRDSDGNSVNGAILRVYRGGTRELTYRRPFDNHIAEKDLISDENGQMTIVRSYDGTQFGGTVCHVFGVIHFSLGGGVPRYDCEITANGYKPYRFNAQRLFDSIEEHRDKLPETIIESEGQTLSLRLYDETLRLERQ